MKINFHSSSDNKKRNRSCASLLFFGSACWLLLGFWCSMAHGGLDDMGYYCFGHVKRRMWLCGNLPFRNHRLVHSFDCMFCSSRVSLPLFYFFSVFGDFRGRRSSWLSVEEASRTKPIEAPTIGCTNPSTCSSSSSKHLWFNCSVHGSSSFLAHVSNAIRRRRTASRFDSSSVLSLELRQCGKGYKRTVSKSTSVS